MQRWIRRHDDAAQASRIERIRNEIGLAKALASSSAALRLFGYQRIDRRPAAVLEVLFNRGLIGAGLTLVGSHAYGALLSVARRPRRGCSAKRTPPAGRRSCEFQGAKPCGGR